MIAPVFEDMPIDAALPALKRALAAQNRVVLAAPPGAGKTTRAPLDLMREDWAAEGKLILLEPRRLAARLAAERMAGALGEPVGRTIGLATRIERKTSSATRIEVVTDGLFARRILSDPELDGVAGVIFDEFHERSLNLDLGFALAADAQTALRPDLRLLLMSATLDVGKIGATIGAKIVESAGRMFPVETRYCGRTRDPIDAQMAAAIRAALRAENGSILAFLPGQAEIRRTAERLGDLPDDIVVAPLYGALSPGAQDAAVAPAACGARKVVLATDIAESSLTIEGVSVVVDAGLARVAIDDGTGPRLETRRASRANVDQRRGRAGRTAPGICYRLWDEAATRGLPPAPTPEILTADLRGLTLALAEWGERDPARLLWIDAPPPGRLAAARAALRAMGALDADGALMPLGRRIAQLPLAPTLAVYVATQEDPGDRRLAAEAAAALSERGLGGSSTDLRERLRRFRADDSGRARSMRNQAQRWSGASELPVASFERLGAILAQGAPGRLARRDPNNPNRYQLAAGGGARLADGDPLSAYEWLAIADVSGSASDPRILAAAPLTREEAEANGRAETSDIAVFDPATKALRARRVRRIGEIVLSETPIARPSGDAARAALLDAVRTHGLDLIPGIERVRALQARLVLLRTTIGEEWPEWPDSHLLDCLEDWLVPALGDPPSLENLRSDRLVSNLSALLDWQAAQRLDRLAPTVFETPSGRVLTIDYGAEGGPAIADRVQAFYGVNQHPSIAGGRIPLAVRLLSPANRPVATTGDLPGFWRGGYRDMAKEMRGRYPKHDWPEDPALATAHSGRPKSRGRRK